jgi:hypothetical protein
MSELTRKERQAIIDKWLNDEEDDEYEVVPMKTKKGKFIVRHKTKSVLQNEDSNDKSQNEVSIEHTRIPAKSQKYINDLRSMQTKDLKSKSKHKRIKDSESQLSILPEILEHIKILGDDIKRKQQKKDIKHEIKHMHLKDKVQNVIIQPERPIPYENDIRPKYIRPKLNLTTLSAIY